MLQLSVYSCKWLTLLMPLVSPLKNLLVNTSKKAGCPLFLSKHSSSLLSGCVSNPLDLLIPDKHFVSSLDNMLPIMNLVNMGAVKHPFDLLYTQVQPCSVHLHQRPSCCRAQRSEIHNSWPLADSCAPGHSGPDWQAEWRVNREGHRVRKSGVQWGAKHCISLQLWGNFVA